jgi:ribonuclease HI
MAHVVIYTRGVSSASGIGGFATVLVHGENRREISGTVPRGSSNRMDIVAAVEGLKGTQVPLLRDTLQREYLSYGCGSEGLD